MKLCQYIFLHHSIFILNKPTPSKKIILTVRKGGKCATELSIPISYKIK